MPDRNVVERYHRYPLVRIYEPITGTDEEWGVEERNYQFVREQLLTSINSATMQAGTRPLQHGREEHWGIQEAIAPSIPFIGEGWLIAFVGPDGENQMTYMVRKVLPLGRGRSRLVLDEQPSFQIEHEEE